MTCKQVQEDLVECWGSADELTSEALSHLETCEQCRDEASLLRETQMMLHSLSYQRAPEGLTEQVMAQIAREQRRPEWRERVAEWLLPTARPSWARAAAVGVALALAVAGGAFWYSQAQYTAIQEPVVASTAAPSAAATEVSAPMDAELDALMLKHQILETTQPLADDVGVGLVVYTSQ